MLPLQNKMELLNICNQSFHLEEVPVKWKVGIVIRILKPGKDPGDVSSYRPITLLSCLGKVMEQIVKNLLEYIVETEKNVEA